VVVWVDPVAAWELLAADLAAAVWVDPAVPVLHLLPNEPSRFLFPQFFASWRQGFQDAKLIPLFCNRIVIMRKMIWIAVVSCFLTTLSFALIPSKSPGSEATKELDDRVRETLASHNRSWSGMNVPEADGKALYDLIVSHGYKSALEIGTSNGYSGMWIAWALSKTGGKLITVELDLDRHKEALEYFRKAGLSQYIDARQGDAHEIVPALSGPFDFVFCDADKEWYENYLQATLPKLKPGGCFAAHNVSDPSASAGRGMRDRRGFGGSPTGGFLQYARSLPNLDTSILNIPGSNGLSVSYKK
jgi:predicted O-methyltransferase YrrM